jgi:hypothetical protein
MASAWPKITEEEPMFRLPSKLELSPVKVRTKFPLWVTSPDPAKLFEIVKSAVSLKVINPLLVIDELVAPNRETS